MALQTHAHTKGFTLWQQRSSSLTLDNSLVSSAWQRSLPRSFTFICITFWPLAYWSNSSDLLFSGSFRMHDMVPPGAADTVCVHKALCGGEGRVPFPLKVHSAPSRPLEFTVSWQLARAGTLSRKRKRLHTRLFEYCPCVHFSGFDQHSHTHC